ncbi:16S rRNA (cytidine(1402)-2'-O)-methyltransferase [Rhodovibrionaceae bacterium A322]
MAGPIGNLGDISLRALAVLREADVIACEDTRVTRKLLSAHSIDRPLLSYHEHNADKIRPRIIEALKSGKSVALLSDAGTPLVSDPGYKLVKAVVAEELPVTALPGPSAVLAALCLSGLPSDRFMFAGFLPPKSGPRRKAFDELKAVPATLIFFESAKRLPASLQDAAAVLGDKRPAAVARELTKLFEEVRRGPLGELVQHYQDAGPPKGEVVVLFGPPLPPDEEDLAEQLDDLLRTALDSQSSLRDAVVAVMTQTGLPKKQVYNRALELSKGRS